jgi:hypothetical protein
VECIDEDTVRISSLATAIPEKDVPECFLEVLDDWGHTWMWKNLQVTGALSPMGHIFVSCTQSYAQLL